MDSCVATRIAAWMALQLLHAADTCDLAAVDYALPCTSGIEVAVMDLVYVLVFAFTSCRLTSF
jgi:hypothetical protein